MNANGHETLSYPDAPGEAASAERPALRFVYASGGRPLDGYTIKRGVGMGGFGEIYYATSDAGKDVALKLVRQHLEVELRGIRQCLNLKHPNLVALYDIRQDAAGNCWIVMEYVAGPSLEDALTAAPNGLPEEQVRAWFHGLAAGVSYLHDRGIVHRDLKPGNVFCDEGLVKVGDYGLSKFIACTRRSGHTESVGTVHYMAPEVANGRYGREIDIYALGIMLYEMLTGRVPFEGESVGEILMKHLTAQADVSMLPEPYRTVIRRALEKDPTQRYRSATEMAAALPPVPPGSNPLGNLSYAGTPGAGRGQPQAGPRHVDEPVLHTIHGWFDTARRHWRDSRLNPFVKILLLLPALGLLLLTAGIWAPAALMLAVAYSLYRLVRMFTPSAPARPPVPPTMTLPLPPPLPRPVPLARRGREVPLPALIVRTPRERWAELLRAMLLSSLVVTVLCPVTVIFLGYHAAAPRPEQVAWVYLMSLAGSWCVLALAQWWDGTDIESSARRFMSMVVGLGLGGLATALAAYLTGVPGGLSLLPSAATARPGLPHLPDSFYASDRSPLGLAYLAVFGTLFLIVGWWRQTDRQRSARLSVSSIVGCAILAGLTAYGWGFPQPWLVLVAATISVAVQLSSPWKRPLPRIRR